MTAVAEHIRSYLDDLRWSGASQERVVRSACARLKRAEIAKQSVTVDQIGLTEAERAVYDEWRHVKKKEKNRRYRANKKAKRQVDSAWAGRVVAEREKQKQADLAWAAQETAEREKKAQIEAAWASLA